MARASCTSIPRQRTVLSNFVWPSNNWTALRFPVFLWIRVGFVLRIVCGRPVFTLAAFQLQANTNCPDALRLQRTLPADHATLVPEVALREGEEVSVSVLIVYCEPNPFHLSADRLPPVR
jgi:hypothetical protein